MSIPESHLAQEAIAALVDGELPSGPAGRAARHLTGCAQCRMAVHAQREAKEALHASRDVAVRGMAVEAEGVGDEALATRRNEGPRSTLVGLVPEGRRSPRHGYAVLKPGVGAEPARHVGHVTSGAPSPTLGHPIAIAAVSPELAEPGVSLAVDVRGTPEPAQVVPLPFYRRPNT